MKKTLGVLFMRPDGSHEARGAAFGAPGVFSLEPVQSLLPPSRHLAGWTEAKALWAAAAAEAPTDTVPGNDSPGSPRAHGSATASVPVTGHFVRLSIRGCFAPALQSLPHISRNNISSSVSVT